MDIISHEQLASYLLPQVVTSADTATKLMLANGLVADILGDLTPIPTRAVAIALEAAARSIRAAGFTSVTTSTDGTSKTWRRDNAAHGDPGVYLTDAEENELIAMATGQAEATGAFTIRPGRR